MKKLILILPILLVVSGCSLLENKAESNTEELINIKQQVQNLSGQLFDLQQENHLLKQNEKVQVSTGDKTIPDSNNDLVLLQEENEKLKKDIEKYKSLIVAIKQEKKELNETTIDNAANEVWEKTPAKIKQIYNKKNKLYFSIDILTHNPDFLPGISDYFINQSTKLREVYITANTKSYICKDTIANVLTDTQTIVESIKKWMTDNNGKPTYYFDIEGAVVKNIYQQCLP